MKTCKRMTMYITLEYENGMIKVNGHTRGNQERKISIRPGLKKSAGSLTDDICNKIEG